MGVSSKKQTVGYKYYLGMHMILCHGPVDAITKVRVDNKTAWSGTQGQGQITVSAEDLFGGEEKEGGISGAVDIALGGVAQTKNSYLQSMLGVDIPAYRGVVGAILRQVYVGLNPYIKPWSFRASRIHVRQNGIVQWYDDKAAIGTDMNPAHIIRECLTDPDWGLGYPEADVDDVSFTQAADTLYSEGMGMSLLWDKSKTLEEFIQDITKHIQGSMYVSRSTGKFVLKLARADYVVGSLLVLDESSVDKITDFKRNTIGEMINSVTVVFWDSSTGKNNSVTVQDIALVAQQKATISTTKQYPGFTTGANAVRAASTELRALSTPLASCVIYTNRKAASLNIGDPFILSWSRYGVTQLVMRVANIELGSLDSNSIKINAIEDAFATASSVYSDPPPSGWVDPNSIPAPCPHHCVIEAPFWELCQRMGETDARAIPSTAGFIVATGVRPSSDAAGARIYTDPTNSGTYQESGVVDFCPVATLSAVASPTDTVIPISSGVDLDLVVLGSYAVWDSELVSVVSVTDTSLTMGRGVLDTVPTAHALGSKIFFADAYFETDQVEYALTEVARIKLLPTTGRGTLSVGSATAQLVTIQARPGRPYPPQKLRIGSLAYPDTLRGDVDIVVTWVHRDRLQQTATLVNTESVSIGPEAGTTYTCQLLTQSGTVISTQTGLSGTTHTFTLATMGSNYGRLRVKLWAVRDGLDSFQSHDWEFTRSGYGAGYGYSYGGA